MHIQKNPSNYHNYFVSDCYDCQGSSPRDGGNDDIYELGYKKIARFTN